MRIVCPACQAAYDVPDSLLVPGRAARCARCGEEWVPLAEPMAHEPPPPVREAEETEPPPPFDDPPAPPDLTGITAMDRLAGQAASVHRSSVALRAAWAASVLLLILLIAAALFWHADLARAWPPSARLFDALGLGPAGGH
jgi:predicted Zn finger-like uncharacterized protein